MGQTILSKGKNVLEAIETGLNLLGIKKDEASIEVIKQERKGFWRLGDKNAIVKLTKIKGADSPTNNSTEISLDVLDCMIDTMESIDHEQDLLDQIEKDFKQPSGISMDTNVDELAGKVWVENGQILCNPSILHYPTITVGKGVKLYQNQTLVNGTTVVTKNDQFEIQTESEMKETKWNISMDPDRLNVYLTIEPGMKKTFKVKDVKPDFHIQLEAEEIIENHNELEYKQVLSSLEELRVIHGFNHSEIMKAVNTDTAGRFTIASGMKPKEGTNGRIELMVDIQKKNGLKERTNGTVDFRDVQVIPTVNKGQVIAIVHPPIPGVPGSTVTNEPLPPKPAYPLIIQTGKGIALIENDTKIVATETGRPVVEQRGLMAKVSIIQKLVHYYDVNLASGHIRFKGDVDILGNVEEGMIVEAGWNITLFKNAYSSSISANNAVFIHGNSIRSTISAGKQNIIASEMVHMLTNIRDQKRSMILSIQQLMNLPAFKMTDYSKKGLFPLIRLLLDKKFQSLLTQIKQFIELSKKGSQLLDLEWLTIAEQLRLCFLSAVPNEYHTMERMNEQLKKIEEMIEKHDVNEQDCFVKLKYALNSTIYSGGDVIIEGQGCFNTRIHAGGNLTINGVLRGGEVFARLGATIKESGSEGGVVSKIIVPSNGTIKIDHAREGTVIQIGKVSHTFQSEQRYITARLDENGRITF